MSLFARPTVALAIVFGCFVVLIPRILLPYFRPRPVYRTDDHFRRNHQENPIESTIDSSDPSPDFVHTDELLGKSHSTFVLPMYVVGIAVFILYTCVKYFGSRQSQEQKIRSRYSPTNIQWNSQKKKFNYQINNRQMMNDIYDEEQQEEDSYAGLDADYVEYLKQRRRDEREREQALTTEQRQMHNTLDEMKHSLSFINSKLGTNTNNMSLTNNEITQLQNRLAQTEAQMYKILSALDVASNKMNEITKNTRQSLEQSPSSPQNRFDYDDDDDDYHQSSNSFSESEDEEDEEVSNDENHRKQDEDESESSYDEEEEEVSHEDDESESSSDRYGLMTTNYGCEESTIDDYDLDEMKKPEETTDSQTKVQEWRERHHSQSLSSNHSSNDDDQATPTIDVKTNEENQLRQRKHQHNE